MPLHPAVTDRQDLAAAFQVASPNGGVVNLSHGVAADVTLSPAGVGTGPFTWSIVEGTLPPGLSLGTDSGGHPAITGTPTAVGTADPVTVRVVDSSTPAKFASASFIFTVS